MNHLEAREKQLQEKYLKLQKKLDAVKSEQDYNAVIPEVKAYEADCDQLNWEKERAAYATKNRGFGNALGHDADTTEKKANRSPLPMDIPVSEWKQAFTAATKRQPYRIDTKGFMGNVSTKAPFGEGDFVSGSLPPILLPQLTMDLPYEPNRAFDAFHRLSAPQARAVEWLQHSGNADPATVVAELGDIPSLGMEWTTQTQTFTKIAAINTYSLESIADSYDVFMRFVPAELQRAIIDAESEWIINDGTVGLLNVSGVLTRSMGSDTPLDAIRKAMVDIRTGSSFANADLVIMHPNTAADLFLQKSTTGQYLVNPSDPTAHSDLSSLFGLQVVQTSKLAAGTAIVADSQWIYSWVRQPMTIDISQEGVDPDSTNLFVQYAVSFRCAERLAVGVARPTAMNIVSGLPS